MNADPSPRSTIAAFALVTVALIGAAVVLLLTRPEPARITINPPVPTATLAPISVYVTGAVGQPNSTVSLPYGSRAADAVLAAGGTAADADLERINLAAIVHDGDQIHVFHLNESIESNASVERPAGEPLLATPAAGDVIHVNTATAEELETLPGIGPALAARILAYREANGRFTGEADLEQVSGIGPGTIERLRGLIAFD